MRKQSKPSNEFPLPWETDAKYPHEVHAADGKLIASVRDGFHNADDETATLIVHRVNCHDALLEACKRLAAFAENIVDGMSRGDLHYIMDIDGLKSAIAKAEGKTP